MHLKVVLTLICERREFETDEHFSDHYTEFRRRIEKSLADSAAIKLPDTTTVRWVIANRSIADRP